MDSNRESKDAFRYGNSDRTISTKKVLRVISIAGSDFKRLYEFNDMVESFAIRTGCSGMELWGRKGWKKLLPDWESNYIVYTKDLKHRMQ